MKNKIKQAYNPKSKAWVKYCFDKDGFKVLDVKQKNPKAPFKGIKIKGKKMRR